MKFSYLHTNLNVLNLARSLKFYQEALGLEVSRRKKDEEGQFELVFLTDGTHEDVLELTWLAEKKEPYALGDNETHLAFRASNYEEAHTKHKEMGIICFENPKMNLYFIEDPDGYWLEILPVKK